MIPTDHELLRLQVQALFRHDAAGRITSTNEPEPAEAPRLFVGWSSGANLWRIRADVPADVVAQVDRLLERGPPLVDVGAVATVQLELVALLAATAPMTSVFAGPSWYVPAGIPTPRRARALTVDDVPALHPNFPYLSQHLERLSPCVGAIEDGVVIAVCSSVRITASACEAGLHTIEAARGRGHGPDAVAVWAAAVHATGRIPLYSTSWENAASRRVAAKLGLVQYAANFSIY